MAAMVMARAISIQPERVGTPAADTLSVAEAGPPGGTPVPVTCEVVFVIVHDDGDAAGCACAESDVVECPATSVEGCVARAARVSANRVRNQTCRVCVAEANAGD
jgi:hypothetical protein